MAWLRITPRWFRKAADQGFAKAQSNLGLMYAEGQGVTQNYPEAAKWYRKGADQGDADQGNADAQYNLGVMYAWGPGGTHHVPNDKTQTARHV
jgi:TPR repeat protein